MKLGILQADSVKKEFVGQFGEYPDMFARLLHAVEPGLEIISYDVQIGEYPDSLDEVDAYLISGSSHSVYEDEKWIHELGAFVKKLHEHKKKTIGICFGHQLVAHVLGGKTEKSTRGWNIGKNTHQIGANANSYRGPDDGFTLLFSHQDEVVKTAKGSKILGSTPQCPIALCKIGNHILTIQGHPEFEKEYARKLMDMRRDLFGEELYQAGVESLSSPNDRLLVAKWMIDFILGDT